MTTERPEASDLRTKYRPRMRLGSGIVGMAPWIDVLLVCALFIAVQRTVTVPPGLVLELPTVLDAAPASTSRGRDVMLVFAQRRDGVEKEIAFFRDGRYDLGNDAKMLALEAALGAQPYSDDDALVIFADAAVHHGTLSRLLASARASGVPRVSIALGIPDPADRGTTREKPRE